MLRARTRQRSVRGRYADLTFRAFASSAQPPAINVAKGDPTPTVSTRACVAFREIITGGKTQLVPVASDVLRTCVREDIYGEIAGYLDEPQAKNVLGENNDFSAWTAEDAGDVVTDDAATGPDGEASAATIVCDNTNGNHGVSLQSAENLTAAKTCASVWVGHGNASWVKIEDVTVANAYRYFNAETGALGTKGAGADEAGFVLGQYIGDADRRIYIRFDGTVALHTIRIRPCDGDGVDTFSGGNGSDVTLYLHAAQCEEGDYPTSRIDTDGGASATRLKDQLQAEGLGNLGGIGSEKRGCIECDILFPNSDYSANCFLFDITDGGGAADRIVAFTAGSDVIAVTTAASGGSGGSANGVTDVIDGVRHRFRLSWQKDDLRNILDGVFEKRDSAVDIPDDLDTMDIGETRAQGSQLNGIMSDYKVFKRPSRR